MTNVCRVRHSIKFLWQEASVAAPESHNEIVGGLCVLVSQKRRPLCCWPACGAQQEVGIWPTAWERMTESSLRLDLRLQCPTLVHTGRYICLNLRSDLRLQLCSKRCARVITSGTCNAHGSTLSGAHAVDADTGRVRRPGLRSTWTRVIAKCCIDQKTFDAIRVQH